MTRGELGQLNATELIAIILQQQAQIEAQQAQIEAQAATIAQLEAQIAEQQGTIAQLQGQVKELQVRMGGEEARAAGAGHAPRPPGPVGHGGGGLRLTKVNSYDSLLLFHLTTTLTGTPCGEADVVRLLTFLLVGAMVGEISRRRRETERLNRQLQELQGAKEKLTRLLVHGLRMPLTNFVLALKVLQKKRGIETLNPAHADHLLNLAIHSGEWLEGMVSDLLAVQQMQESTLR